MTEPDISVGASAWKAQLFKVSLENAISKMCNIPVSDVEINGAGRTDAGVHARAMIAFCCHGYQEAYDSALEFLNKKSSK